MDDLCGGFEEDVSYMRLTNQSIEKELYADLEEEGKE